MKKLLCVLITLVIAVSFALAQDINLGEFPLGSWVDKNWDAVWEFTGGNIRILGLDGTVICDFGEVTVQDFKIGPGDGGLVISFSCKNTAKTYTLTKPLTSLDIILEIDRTDKEHYKVTMARQ